jgi:hypothetical protein
MHKFGYTFKEMAEMTQEQIAFLITGLDLEARERQSAQRRAKLKRR